MNVPGGQMSERFGVKPIIVVALVVSAIGTLLTPFIVHFGEVVGMIILRFVIGLSQGGLFPAINGLLAIWVPLHERGRLSALIYCGLPVRFSI